MEKLTRPYLRRGLGTREESEPWLMSGLKLSPFLPANRIPLPWSQSFTRATSFKERSGVKNAGVGSFSVAVEFPGGRLCYILAAAPCLSPGPPWSGVALSPWHPFSRNFSPCLHRAVILAGDVQIICSSRALSDASTSD